MNLNRNIDLSPGDSNEAESIWSTLLNYSYDHNLFDGKSNENNIRSTQSPKRQHSVEGVLELFEATPELSKRVTTFSSPKKQKLSKQPTHITKIGSITLPWPQYEIPHTIYMNKRYAVTKTCSLDSALFVFYHGYKIGSSEFRKLFQSDTTRAHTALRKLFMLVDSDGWNIARLQWLLSNRLLNKINDDGVFDVEDTLYENVLQFIRPMQMYNIKTECSCIMCPKRIRENKSIDISLS